VPTLYTCGALDEATPVACADFAALTPNARLVVVEGCSHMAHLEQPLAYLSAIRSFLADGAITSSTDQHRH
jgi:pimeloyl-ACP methyl ester carboxylesterase